MSITDGDKLRLEREIERLENEIIGLQIGLQGYQQTRAERDALKDKLGQVYRQQAEELDIASDAMEWAANERDKLVAERDAAIADAKRYRWIVSKIVGDDFDSLERAFGVFGDDAESCTSAEFDFAIDKAIQQEPQ